MMTMTITYDLARRGPAWKQNALKNLLTNLWSPAQQHQSCFRVPVLGARPHATNENCLKQGEPSCTGRPRSWASLRDWQRRAGWPGARAAVEFVPYSSTFFSCPANVGEGGADHNASVMR